MSITRTTISIDSGLLATAKQVASRRRRTLGELVAQGLQRVIVESDAGAQPQAPLPTLDLGAVRGGIDLTSNAELYDMMDREDMARWSYQM